MIEKKESTARRFSGGLFRIGDAPIDAPIAQQRGLNGRACRRYQLILGTAAPVVYDGEIQFLSLCVGSGGIAGSEMQFNLSQRVNPGSVAHQTVDDGWGLPFEYQQPRSPRDARRSHHRA
ncbi:hypothetical protein D9M68_481240 [compost metagenome]